MAGRLEKVATNSANVDPEHPALVAPSKNSLRKYRNWPLYTIMAWWGFCFGLYAIGWPIEYPRTNFATVFILYLAVAAFTYFGFKIGTNLTVEWSADRWRWAPALGLLFGLLLLLPTLQLYSGLGITDFGLALENQAEAYQVTSEHFEQGLTGGSPVYVLLVATSFLTMSVLPYYATRFRSRNPRTWLPLILALVPPLTISVLTGRDHQFGIVVVTLMAAGLVVQARRDNRISGKVLVAAAIGGVSALGIIVYRKFVRISGTELCSAGQLNCAENDYGFWGTAVRMIASYSAQGLEGLGRALDAEWAFGGGLAHSIALEGMVRGRRNEVETVTDQLDLLGWSSTANWSTALTQLSDDIPWVLIPAAIGAWALLLGASWKLAVQQMDWLTVALFAYTFYGFVFIPQNFQLGISGQVYVGYICMVLLLIFFALTKKGQNVP